MNAFVKMYDELTSFSSETIPQIFWLCVVSAESLVMYLHFLTRFLKIASQRWRKVERWSKRNLSCEICSF
jgi:hypothetical protein